MLGKNHYQRLQNILLSRLSKQESVVTLDFPKFVEGTKLETFRGETQKLEGETHEYKCLYRRPIFNDNERSDKGIDEDIEYLIYISPLEIKEKTGVYLLPDKVYRAHTEVKISFFGRDYNIDQCNALEPFELEGEMIPIAYEFRVKKIV